MRAFKVLMDFIDSWLGGHYKALGQTQKQLVRAKLLLKTKSKDKSITQQIDQVDQHIDSLLTALHTLRQRFLEQAEPVRLLKSIPPSGPAGIFVDVAQLAWKKMFDPGFQTTKEKYEKGLQKINDRILSFETTQLSNSLGTPDNAQFVEFIRDHASLFKNPRAGFTALQSIMANYAFVDLSRDPRPIDGNQASTLLSEASNDETSFESIKTELINLCTKLNLKLPLLKRAPAQAKAIQKLQDLHFISQPQPSKTAFIKQLQVVATQSAPLAELLKELKASMITMHNDTLSIQGQAKTARDTTMSESEDYSSSAMQYFSFFNALFGSSPTSVRPAIEDILSIIQKTQDAIHSLDQVLKNSIDSSPQNEGSSPSVTTNTAKLLERKRKIYSSLKELEGGSNVRTKN